MIKTADKYNRYSVVCKLRDTSSGGVHCKEDGGNKCGEKFHVVHFTYGNFDNETITSFFRVEDQGGDGMEIAL